MSENAKSFFFYIPFLAMFWPISECLLNAVDRINKARNGRAESGFIIVMSWW